MARLRKHTIHSLSPLDMSIRFKCDCGKLYNVPDEHAGKKVKCKTCGAGLTIPIPDVENIAPADSVASQPTGPQWRVASHDGQQYGPVSKEELDGWVVEGLLTANCQLICDGQAQWQLAVNVYPQLAAQHPPGAAVQQTGQHWRIASHDGQQYGPISKDELDNWVAEGVNGGQKT